MEAGRQQEQAALVALLRATAAAWPEVTADVLEAGSALAVWRDWRDEHEPATLLDAPDTSEADPLAAAAADIARWAGQDWHLTTILDDGYPARLREIHQAPPFLFWRGKLLPGDPAVAVVGSRDASGRALGIARGIAHELVRRKISVAAGLARGIDTAAHRTALDEGGRTVAVIGTGISRVYPPENAGLHDEIAARGLLVSQFWPDAPPQKHTFLMRNATMSGYSLATIVVEAGEKSGARVQARLAVEHGRPVILTDLVAERNEWARAMAGRPGVQVASGLRETAGLIDRLIAGQQDVRADLDKLAAARAGTRE
ncbi:MAG TPA: DNA-processing protein DprA [Streptosporangiaceae bacterium]|nr:DNA-processing protein DprA [Streptosporangiaceae bacterium]